jgi:membrane protein DedA with SNARE-associated domain
VHPAFRLRTLTSGRYGSGELTNFISSYGLLAVVIIIITGELGLPTLIPAEVAMLIVANRDITSIRFLLGAILLLGAVDLLATTTIHLLARAGGPRVVRSVQRLSRHRLDPEKTLARLRYRLGNRDTVVIFWSRMVPVVRLYASITSGVMRMNFRRFISGAASAAWIWASIPLTAGYVLRSRSQVLVNGYTAALHVTVPLALTALFAATAIVWMRRTRRPATVQA